MTNAQTIAALCEPQTSSARFIHKRLAREFNTIAAMVRIYCRDQHHECLCADCKSLLDYASLRLERCRFGVDRKGARRWDQYQRRRGIF